PDERHIGAGGFEARWRTTRLATGGQPFWEPLARKDGLRSDAGASGVALFEPVNVYSLSYRATEYAFLFILFTFAALALLEALAGVRLHPVQYALVGSAIAVFFLLLLAISEHAPFSFAYGSAAAACATLIAAYLRHPLRSAPRAAGFGALVAALYGLLYVLLVREDDALLLGSLLVFALLATVMMATRKLDWHEMASRVSRTPPRQEVTP
ncbi:MAG TPA: inner membrane CreD family protein, partial [Usitatibacter sp.]|nr:inner membrane CreD family protein [Usitatibacter sp.]